MVKQTCYWKGCKEIIEVEQLSNNSLFVTVGWCSIHKDAFHRYYKMEKSYCKRNRLCFPVTSKTYQQHKKAFNQLHDLAEKQAKRECN